MPHIVFVAPRFLENTNRYVAAFADLPEVQLSVISEDTARAIPDSLRDRVLGHYRVQHALNPQQLTAACRALQRAYGPIDRIAGALEQLQLPLATVRDALDIEGMRYAVALNFRDKDRMKDVLRAHGIAVARSGLATTMSQLRKFADLVGYPIIVKPQAGLGARSTYRINHADDLDALERAGKGPTQDAPLQAEEFVRAREHTCEAVTIRGKTVWRSGTRYLPSPLEVLENPWMQYCVLLPRETDGTVWSAFAPAHDAALHALLGASASSAAGTALTHMEWFLRDDGEALVNEVGARPPGVCIMPLMSLAHQTNMVEDWARLMALEEFTPKPRVFAAGAAFLRGQGSGQRIASVSGVARAVELAGDHLVELRVPKPGQARAESYEGEGWATVRADSTELAHRALKELIETIQVRYA